MPLLANDLNTIENNIQQGNGDSLKNNKDLKSLLNTGINIYRDEQGHVDFDNTKNLLEDEELSFFLNKEIEIYSLKELAGEKVFADYKSTSTTIRYRIESKKDISNYSVNSFAHTVSQHPIVGFRCKDVEFVVDLVVAAEEKYALPHPSSGVSWSSSYSSITLKIGELNLPVTSRTLIPNLNYQPITIEGVTYYGLSTLTLHFACSNKDFIFNKGFINENARIVFPGSKTMYYEWGSMPRAKSPSKYRLIISNFNTNLIDSSEINPLKYYIDSAVLSEKETPLYERNYELWRNDQYCSTPIFPHHIEHFVEEHNNNIDRLMVEKNIYETDTNIFTVRDYTGNTNDLFASLLPEDWKPTLLKIEEIEKENIENRNILYKNQVEKLKQHSSRAISQSTICPKNISTISNSLINYQRDTSGKIVFDTTKTISKTDETFYIVIPFKDIYSDYINNLQENIFNRITVQQDDQQYVLPIPFGIYNQMFTDSPEWSINDTLCTSDMFSNFPWSSITECQESGILFCYVYYAYPQDKVPNFEDGKTLEDLFENFNVYYGNSANTTRRADIKRFYNYINYYLSMIIGNSEPEFQINKFDMSAVLNNNLYIGNKQISLSPHSSDANYSVNLLNRSITVNNQKYVPEPELANCKSYGSGVAQMPRLSIALNQGENMIDLFSNRIYFKPNSTMQSGSLSTANMPTLYVKSTSKEKLEDCKEYLKEWVTKLLTDLHLVFELRKLNFSYYNPKKIINLESEGE